MSGLLHPFHHRKCRNDLTSRRLEFRARVMAKWGAFEACCCFLGLLAGVALLFAAFSIVVPVQVTVDEATLGHLALAAPGNGTPASLAYDLSLLVTLHNHNWAMSARLTAPLDATLRFAGRTFARVPMAAADGDRMHRLTMVSYRVSAAGDNAEAALGSYAAAEFARERASGVYELELFVAGEFRFTAHFHEHSLRVFCPLKLSVSTATKPASFARVKCTCLDA